MPYIIYWFIGWRFSSKSLSSVGFDSEISFLFSWQTRSIWSPLFSSPLLSSEEEDDEDEGSCWTLVWTSLSKDEIGQLIILVFRVHVSIQGGKINTKHCSNYQKNSKDITSLLLTIEIEKKLIHLWKDNFWNFSYDSQDLVQGGSISKKNNKCTCMSTYSEHQSALKCWITEHRGVARGGPGEGASDCFVVGHFRVKRKAYNWLAYYWFESWHKDMVW